MSQTEHFSTRQPYATPRANGTNRTIQIRQKVAAIASSWRRAVEGRLGDLKREQTAIVRRQTASGTLDALDAALAEILEEEAELQRELTEIRRRDELVTAQASIPDRIDALAAACRDLLVDPDEDLMADIFDVLEIRLDLVEPYRFEGSASIPIAEDTSGDFRKEGPQHR